MLRFYHDVYCIKFACMFRKSRFFVFGFDLEVFMMFATLCATYYIWWFVGVERFSDYIGYADTFEFDGEHTDRLPV